MHGVNVQYTVSKFKCCVARAEICQQPLKRLQSISIACVFLCLLHVRGLVIWTLHHNVRQQPLTAVQYLAKCSCTPAAQQLPAQLHTPGGTGALVRLPHTTQTPTLLSSAPSSDCQPRRVDQGPHQHLIRLMSCRVPAVTHPYQPPQRRAAILYRPFSTAPPPNQMRKTDTVSNSQQRPV